MKSLTKTYTDSSGNNRSRRRRWRRKISLLWEILFLLYERVR